MLKTDQTTLEVSKITRMLSIDETQALLSHVATTDDWARSGALIAPPRDWVSVRTGYVDTHDLWFATLERLADGRNILNRHNSSTFSITEFGVEVVRNLLRHLADTSTDGVDQKRESHRP